MTSVNEKYLHSPPDSKKLAGDKPRMKTLILLSALISSQAFAINPITCQGAVDLSLRDAETTTRGINTMPMHARMALEWVQRDVDNLGNITAACREEFPSKLKFCSRLPALVKAREPGLTWNVTGNPEDRMILATKHQDLLEQIQTICE